jgi:N-methylhydantoinase A
LNVEQITMNRVAVDIGGTFTDCFVAWRGRFIQAKALTTHRNLAIGFNEAIDNACVLLGVDRAEMMRELDSVRYATTLGTNALIERRGPKVGLLCTHGFEATVPISRCRGYAEGLPLVEARDLAAARRPDPIVPPVMIRGVRERLDHRGRLLIPLDEQHARLQIRELVDQGMEALVISLTNSVANPLHELRLQELIRAEFPAYMLGSIPVVLSHRVAGRRGEYVRTSSAIIDAFLHSTMYHAMSQLDINLRESCHPRPMLLVHNTGGMAQLNSTDALQTVHSGPVAGVYASEELARQGGLGNVVSTDMGGTSFDIGMVVAGGYKHYDFTPVIDRWLVTTPMIHLVTLGAGGGSIAKYDRMYGSVKIGPKSAGSDPGPACYDRGGLEPTVTDADLILGYLDPRNYANGKIPLNRRRSVAAMEDLCDELDSDAIGVAKRIKQTADADMGAGIVRELRSRGYQPSDFTMLAYGGNGPLHCCGIAAQSGITRALAPPYSSVFSACGAAAMTQMHIHERTETVALYNQHTKQVFQDFAYFNGIVGDLEARGRADLLRQGISEDRVLFRLELDLRYGNQKMETSIIVPTTRIATLRDVLSIVEMLAVDFAARYGESTTAPESGVWITTFRVVSYVETQAPSFESMLPPEQKRAAPTPVAVRECHFVSLPDGVPTPVFGSEALVPGTVIEGPAVINTGQTTYLVEPGWRFEAANQGAAWFFRSDVSAASR